MKRALGGLMLLLLVAISTSVAFPLNVKGNARIGPVRTYPIMHITPAPMITAFWRFFTPTPRPTDTPRPTTTHRPTATPKPRKTRRPTASPTPVSTMAVEPSALDRKLSYLIDEGKLVEVFDGSLLDVDGDGAPDELRFSWDTDAYGTGTYTLSTNLSSFSGSCESLIYTLYAGKLSGLSGPTYLMVADNGPSDDPVCHIFEYSGLILRSVGSVPALPSTFIIGDTGFSTEIRGHVLHTWFRPAEYQIVPPVAEVPRDLYPMNHNVTMLIDLPLMEERGGAAVSATLHAGEEAMLATTDDVEWVYIIRREDKTIGGWMHLVDGYYCEVGDALLDPGYVFDGLNIAD